MAPHETSSYAYGGRGTGGVLIGVISHGTSKTALRVLIIEASPDAADLAIAELRAAGYTLDYQRVDSAASLRTALCSDRFQLALCDYSLPGFDALAALAIIKEHKLDLPFIIVSGAVGEETAIAAMKAGAHDFVLKGKLARLGPAVERELREAALRSERAALQQQLLLSDRLVQIGTLAASVAHEINDPLAYVIGNVAFAIDELSESERPAVLQALQRALEGCESIRAISANLRVFSRSDDAEKQRVEVKRVLESACSLAWNQIRLRAQLIKDFQDVPPIAANESRLGQVFLNLLINAAQAIPAGDAASHQVRVSLRQLDDYVEIDVSDTGLGIAAEAREHLFQPFFTTKPKGVGTGLGLSICQKIVRDCGGDITAHANPRAGTTFRVRLPIGTLTASAKPPLLSSHPSIRRGRVLVIDDEPGIVDVVTRVLRTEHETVGVVGARAGLELLSRDPGFEVIFCDLMMPDMNGVEFYAALQRSAPQLTERVVFLSGGAFTLEIRQFLSYVENLRLQKPFDTKTLRAIVREQLTRLDARRLLGAIAPARS